MSAKPRGGGAKAKITPENLPRVQQLVDQQPDAILEELCERLYDSCPKNRGQNISLIGRTQSRRTDGDDESPR